MTNKELVDALMKIKASQFDLWKYFEGRADQLGERLWTIGIWLMAVIGATLSLPFAAKFVTVTEGALPIPQPEPAPMAVSFCLRYRLCHLRPFCAARYPAPHRRKLGKGCLRADPRA